MRRPGSEVLNVSHPSFRTLFCFPPIDLAEPLERPGNFSSLDGRLQLVELKAHRAKCLPYQAHRTLWSFSGLKDHCWATCRAAVCVTVLSLPAAMRPSCLCGSNPVCAQQKQHRNGLFPYSLIRVPLSVKPCLQRAFQLYFSKKVFAKQKCKAKLLLLNRRILPKWLTVCVKPCLPRVLC